jgi:hypothetical protein
MEYLPCAAAGATSRSAQRTTSTSTASAAPIPPKRPNRSVSLVFHSIHSHARGFESQRPSRMDGSPSVTHLCSNVALARAMQWRAPVRHNAAHVGAALRCGTAQHCSVMRCCAVPGRIHPPVTRAVGLSTFSTFSAQRGAVRVTRLTPVLAHPSACLSVQQRRSSSSSSARAVLTQCSASTRTGQYAHRAVLGAVLTRSSGGARAFMPATAQPRRRRQLRAKPGSRALSCSFRIPLGCAVVMSCRIAACSPTAPPARRLQEPGHGAIEYAALAGSAPKLGGCG